ncbi:hypothetical protein [Nocardia sp. NPDC127526]|uniref:hypothetical protein n=1 Tax=Nocardia sp. NPDC127526 TaxID=3345393 RepID=UPI00363B4EC7
MMQLTGRSVRTLFALDAVGPRTGETTVDASRRGWNGPHGGVVAGLLVDALPPTLDAPLPLPTVAMSLYLHTELALAPPQPVLVTASNVLTAGGWSVDDVDLRDRDGRLLTQDRQTRRVLG